MPDVAFRDALAFWIRLGFINFGGPTGQIAIMHDELVERRRWIDEERFLHALNFAMLLPGPEAHQLAIYIGWLLNGSPGAIAAGVFFLLPALVLIIFLSWVYAVHGDVAWVSAIFDGLAWAVVGIVAAALIRIAQRALKTRLAFVIAIAAFIALLIFGIPFPIVILAAGFFGLGLGVRVAGQPREASPVLDVGRPGTVPTWGRAGRVLVVGLVIWLLPLALVALAIGPDGVIAQEALFFSFMALVTFGGAYAVLAYVNQAAVLRFGWLTSGEMAVGLSLAESTPGPLILTVVFAREPATRGRRDRRSAGDRVGDVRAEFPIHLSRCAIRRATSPQSAARGCACGDHSCRRRCGRQLGRRVRGQRSVHRTSHGASVLARRIRASDLVD